jgi:two-component system sensor histidine kinase/response regulator
LVRAADLRNTNVLVVDDSDIARQVLEDMLTPMGVSVEAAASGEDALAKLAEGKYDVVLLDWRMPGMDGVETARRIQSMSGTKPRIIMVTAYGREEFFEQTRKLELAGTLLKPVSASTLFDALASALSLTAAPARTEPLTLPQATALSGATILLAEDNAINQEIATEILEQAGYSVVGAENGEMALRKLRDEDFDVVLMDLQMPVMDGFQATAELRRDPKLKSIPVIAMTAHAMTGDRERCLAAGMDDYVTKPVDPETLLQTIERWSQSAARRRRAEKAAVPEIRGVNTRDGLARVGGNAGLYMRLLSRFRDEQAEAPARIREALEMGDREVAIRLAHTVKGVAANLGMEDVAAAAAELERSMDESALSRLRVAVLDVCQAIPVMSEKEPGTNGSVSPEKLTRIRAMLEAGDTEVLTMLTDLPEVAACAQQFDFEGAIAAVDKLTPRE